jgi:hypothetical protein
VAGIRPEDVVLESAGSGIAAHIDSDIDLGHYRRVSLSVEGAKLLAFVPKSEVVPADPITLRPTRMLVYAEGHLVGVTELAPAAVRQPAPVTVPARLRAKP